MTPPTFDWNLIDSGDALQALAGCLLLQEVSKHVAVFAKPGRDYCIDGSFDGTHGGVTGKWRYQSKHYADLSDLKTTLRGAPSKKGEIARILEHLDAGPDDRGGKLWHGCTHYRLITNVDLLPQERQEVLDILAPLAARGIDVDVWHRTQFQAMCEQQPLVMQQFFGQDPPAFVPVAEFLRQKTMRDGGERLRTLPWVGRDEALSAFAGFMAANSLVLVLHGAGGVGKTRAMIEFARSIDDDPALDVRFLQNDSQTFDPHLASLRHGRRLVLFVDDADDVDPDQLTRVLSLAARGVPLGGRAKVILATRSATISTGQVPARKAVGVRLVEECELRPVTTGLESVTRALDVPDSSTGALLALAGGVPIWLSLGADALAGGESPATLTRDRVIRFHLDLYLRPLMTERDLHERVLYTLSAIEPINLADQQTRTTIAQLVQADVPSTVRALDQIRQARFVADYGRYIKLTPDLLADYLIQQALFTETGIPTDFQHQLLRSDVPDKRRLINNLARAEYLSGKPVLADVAQSALASISAGDNAERFAILQSLGGAAIVRPVEFLAMARAVLDHPSPEPAQSRDPQYAAFPALAPRHTHDQVLALVVDVLYGPLRWYEHRRAALELLAGIAETEGRSAQRARDAFKKALSWGQDGVDLGEQTGALEMIRQWVPAGQPARHVALVVEGLKQLLAIETVTTSLDEGGIHLVMSYGRLPLTEELRRLRASALTVVFELARAPDVATRRRAAKLVHDVIQELLRATGPRDRQAVVSGEDDPMKPVLVPYTLPDIGSADDVEAQFRELFARVESEAAGESDATVLVEWEACVNWHARFAPKTELGQEAARIIAAMRQRPGHRLGRALLGRTGDHRNEDELEAVAAEVLKTRSAEEFLAIVQDIARSEPGAEGPIGQFLFRLAMRDPAYGAEILTLCDRQQDTPGLPLLPLGMLVSALHVSGTDRGLVRRLSERGGRWRRTAAIAAGRLRPEWHHGFSLSDDDLALIRELALDAEPSVWQELAHFAPSLARHEPDVCLALARDMAARHGEEALKTVAEMCRDLLERDTDRYRPPIVAIVDEFFVPSPQLDEYWIAHLLAKLAANDLRWLVNFFDARIRAAEAADAGIRAFRVVPEVIDQMLPSVAAANAASVEFATVLFQVLQWALSTGRRAHDGTSVLRKLVGKCVTPSLVAAIKEAVTPATAVDLARPASTALRAFADDAGKFAALFELLDGIDKSTAEQRDAAIRALVNSIGGGGITAAMGRPPPAYVQLLELLRGFETAHPDHGAVRSFVEHARRYVEAQLEWHRQHDEEFRLGL
jgi:hypothetical protein